MRSIKIILLIVIILPFIFYSCSEDEPTSPSLKKADIFAYGLLGLRPHRDDPDSSHFWVYARVFNHPDYQNVHAELSHGTTIIPLESDHWDSDMYFTVGRLNFSFEPGENYGFKIWDSKNTYSGTITTLPQIKITVDTIIADQLILEWTDINADFYNIGFRNWGNFDKNFQVETNRFTININELPLNSSSSIDIDVGGFKGFSPISHPVGNIKGCYGYLFGYSRDETKLDLQTMTFSKKNRDNSTPNLDKLILSLLDNNSARSEDIYTTDINFKFTYGYIYNSGYSQSGYNSFRSVTIVEPANAIKVFEGYINDILLDSYNWSSFYNILEKRNNVYETYDKNMRFKFKLNINKQLDSASVSIPDTFSIVYHPPTDNIPAAPFNIGWRRPANADFFFVDVSWSVEGDSLDKNYLYVTNDNSYNFSDIPDSVIWGRINIIAINGANPMKILEPNLERLNGYFYSSRSCKDGLIFSPDNLKKGLSSNTYSVNEKKFELNKRIDNFIISRLAEKYPKLQNYKLKLINQINKEAD